MRNQRPIDPVNLVLHHLTLPLEAAWNVIEHEAQLVAIPKFIVPCIVEDLVDPVGIGRF
jgi:hypothetical protein